jgi:hypothetical protein
MTHDGLYLGGAEVPPDDVGRHVGYRLVVALSMALVADCVAASGLVWLQRPDGGGWLRGPQAYLALLEPGDYWVGPLAAVLFALAAAGLWARRPQVRLPLLAGTALGLAVPLLQRAARPQAGQDPALGFTVELLALPALALLLGLAAWLRTRVHPWRRDAWVRRPVEVAVAGVLAVAAAAGLVLGAGALVQGGSLAAAGWLDASLDEGPLAVPDGPGPVRWHGAVPEYLGTPGYQVLGAGRGVVALAADRPGRSPDGQRWSGVSVRDAATGTERWHVYGSLWRIRAGGVFDGTLVVLGTGRYPASPWDGFVMGFDARSGALRWQRPVASGVKLPGTWSLWSGSQDVPLPLTGPWIVLTDADSAPQQSLTRLTVLDPANGGVAATVNAERGCQFLAVGSDRQRLYAEQVCATNPDLPPFTTSVWGLPVNEAARMVDGAYRLDGGPLWTVSRVLPHPLQYLGIARVDSDAAVVRFIGSVGGSGDTQASWHSVVVTRDAVTGQELTGADNESDRILVDGGTAVSLSGPAERPVLEARDLRGSRVLWSVPLPGPVRSEIGWSSGTVYLAFDASTTGGPQRLRVAAYEVASGQALPDAAPATLDPTPCPAAPCTVLTDYRLLQAGNVVVAVAKPWTASGASASTVGRSQQVWAWPAR